MNVQQNVNCPQRKKTNFSHKTFDESNLMKKNTLSCTTIPAPHRYELVTTVAEIAGTTEIETVQTRCGNKVLSQD